uniref:Uncharacterized protein n=1 Tax=Anopheles coluzzii TaxID=1518534 RepID=A0A8W7Q1F9_ANOCL
MGKLPVNALHHALYLGVPAVMQFRHLLLQSGHRLLGTGHARPQLLQLTLLLGVLVGDRLVRLRQTLEPDAQLLQMRIDQLDRVGQLGKLFPAYPLLEQIVLPAGGCVPLQRRHLPPLLVQQLLDDGVARPLKLDLLLVHVHQPGGQLLTLLLLPLHLHLRLLVLGQLLLQVALLLAQLRAALLQLLDAVLDLAPLVADLVTLAHEPLVLLALLRQQRVIRRAVQQRDFDTWKRCDGVKNSPISSGRADTYLAESAPPTGMLCSPYSLHSPFSTGYGPCTMSISTEISCRTWSSDPSAVAESAQSCTKAASMTLASSSSVLRSSALASASISSRFCLLMVLQRGRVQQKQLLVLQPSLPGHTHVNLLLELFACPHRLQLCLQGLQPGFQFAHPGSTFRALVGALFLQRTLLLQLLEPLLHLGRTHGRLRIEQQFARIHLGKVLHPVLREKLAQIVHLNVEGADLLQVRLLGHGLVVDLERALGAVIERPAKPPDGSLVVAPKYLLTFFQTAPPGHMQIPTRTRAGE